ncbi:site-specific recombinase [Lachnospiraceae bacterium 5_1_63FAA]|nr:site-specific recombinase [Lachnospiraceae bacterium 5_1_63FAA]
MAGIRTENKIYEVGMYCRLSKDDGTDNESASIATQKSILTDYVKKAGMALSKKRMWTMVTLVRISKDQVSRT